MKPSMSLSKLAGKILVVASMSGCVQEMKQPDMYYLQITPLKLAIPSIYINSSAGIETFGTRSDVYKRVATSPGMELDGFVLWVDYSNLKPWDKSKKNLGIADVVQMSFANLLTTLRVTPSAKITNIRSSNYRDVGEDKFNLIAYSEGPAGLYKTINYLTEKNSEAQMIISCSGFNQPNPMCRASMVWRNILLEYDFRFIYLQDWQSKQVQIVNLLNSFAAQ